MDNNDEFSIENAEKGHFVFQPIFDKIRQKGSRVHVVSTAPFGFSFLRNIKRALEMKGSQQLGTFVPLECYFSINLIIKLFKAKRHFNLVYQKLTKSPQATTSLKFQNIAFLSSYPNYFEYYFRTYLPLSVLYYELALNAINQEKINLVFLVDEYLQLGRALQFAAHKARLPVVAIQHGIIHRYHPGYFYTPKVISPKKGAHFPYAPLPLKTAVYGPHTKQILTEVSAYPKPSVVVTGQPRYDRLTKVHEIYSRADFCQQHKLDPKKPIALLATQPFPLDHLRVEFFENTMQALKAFTDIQVVIKPHPNEKSQWHQTKLSTMNVDATVLPPHGDTIEAIFASDLFFSVNSTTILEALLLQKPVIVVNFSNLPEVLPWTSDNAVIEVKDITHLKKATRQLLQGDKIRQTLETNRATFLYSHLFKIDGKATERMMNLIEELLD